MFKKESEKKEPKKQKKQRHHLKHHPVLTFFRVVKNGFKNLWRNAWLSIAATAIMTVTLTTILVALFANKALTDTIDSFAKQITLSVYLKDDAGTQKQVDLRNTLEQSEFVESVEYISKEDALSKFQDDFNNDAELLEAFEIVEGNVLPASFQITLSDLERADSVSLIAQQDEFEEVVDSTSINDDREKIIDRFSSGQDFIVITGFVIASIFAAISVLVIFNTIRLAIYSRSDEVRTMKLLGASHGYIRGPFLFEAVMYGAAAGIISFIAIYVFIKNVVVNIVGTIEVGGAIKLLDDNWWIILIGTVAAGMIIGFISSMMALSRYMRY